MKKVLLATSFLVALSSTTFASDFTISGKHEFNYQSWDDNVADAAGESNTLMTNDSTITIKAKTTLENGWTIGATLLDQEDGVHDTDGVNAYVSGDFGKVVFGGNSAGDSYSIDGRVAGDDYLGTGDVEYAGGEEIGVSGEENGISYHIGNDTFQAGIGYVDAGTASTDDTISYGASATIQGLTLQAAFEDDELVETLSLGGSADIMGTTVTVAQNSYNDDAETYDYTGWSYGIETSLSDTLTVAAHLATAEDDKDAGFDYEEKAVTLTKALAPGLETHLTWTDYAETQTAGSLTDENGTSYNFGITMTF